MIGVVANDITRVSLVTREIAEKGHCHDGVIGPTIADDMNPLSLRARVRELLKVSMALTVGNDQD